MNFAKYIKYILILFIIFLIFLIYRILFNEKEILILTSDEPIKEQPIDAPEMKDPEITPCVYSLWNENTPCQSTEDLLNAGLGSSRDSSSSIYIVYVLYIIVNVLRNFSIWFVYVHIYFVYVFYMFCISLCMIGLCLYMLYV